MSYAFGLLKPDCVKRGLVQEVMNIIILAGLQVVASKRVRLTKEQCAIVWPVCTKQTYWEEMLEFSLSEDSVVFIVKGDNATARLKDFVGDYDPQIAKEGTIRRRFGTSKMEDIIHSANDEAAFWEQTELFFNIQFV